MRRRLRQPREDLQRPGEVELRQLREDEEADVEGGHLVPSSGLKCASDSVPDAAMGQFWTLTFVALRSERYGTLWRDLEGVFSKRDHEFESGFLQQRVRGELDFRGESHGWPIMVDGPMIFVNSKFHRITWPKPLHWGAASGKSSA